MSNTRNRRRCHSAIGLKLSLEGIISELSAPYHSGRSENWTKAKCRAGHEVVLGGWKTTTANSAADGGRLSRRSPRLCRIVGTGFGQDTVGRIMPALQGGGVRREPFWRQGCAAQDPRRALG